MKLEKEKSSFRDKCSQVYLTDDGIIREIRGLAIKEYNMLMISGLYKRLTEEKLLIEHEELSDKDGVITIHPETVPFISYPYEWSFKEYKEAALVTLKINRIAMEYGMALRDASAFNIQYHQHRFKLIDTTSLGYYVPTLPWNGYAWYLRQFFIPLLLLRYKNPELVNMWLGDIYGISAKVAVSILPKRLMLKPSILAHIYGQAENITSKRAKNDGLDKNKLNASKKITEALLYNLENAVKGLKYKRISDWERYADYNSYDTTAKIHKIRIVKDWLGEGNGKTLCDLGANTGEFSKIALDQNYDVIAVDSDYPCLEEIDDDILSLRIDINNPTPAIGWANEERRSFWDRLQVDTILFLALIHHICIGNSVPLGKVAKILSEHCQKLIIEFVPLNDDKAQLLMSDVNIYGNKVDHPDYSYELFRCHFEEYFNFLDEVYIRDSQRIMCLLEVKRVMSNDYRFTIK